MINYSKKRFNINLNEKMIDLSEYKNIWEEIEKEESKKKANK